MTESFLHHVWKFRLFNHDNLKTTTGENIEVLKTGEHNTHAGPDFSNARIKLGDTLWAGNVEIHLHSSDWLKHGHNGDKAYENVILHVVYEDDGKQSSGSIPLLVLKGKISDEVYQNYLSLQNSSAGLPCFRMLDRIGDITMEMWLYRMLVERLEEKSAQILDSLKLNRNNWEETFYYFLARNFGFKINAVPFELMAKSLPVSIISRYKNNLTNLEALIFGQAGFLDREFTEEYPAMLRRKYLFLKGKHSLQQIDNSLWKFLRMRPGNFPTVRLAQFAALMFKKGSLFSRILECKDAESLRILFNVKASEYWSNHFLFEKESANSSKKLGNSSIDNILINTVAPFFFVYGIRKDSTVFKERAIRLLEELNAEHNSVVALWEEAGVKVDTAFGSQALLQLKNNYCSFRRCLECSIGNKIISS